MLLFLHCEKWYLIFFDLALSSHLYKAVLFQVVCIDAPMNNSSIFKLLFALRFIGIRWWLFSLFTVLCGHASVTTSHHFEVAEYFSIFNKNIVILQDYFKIISSLRGKMLSLLRKTLASFSSTATYSSLTGSWLYVYFTEPCICQRSSIAIQHWGPYFPHTHSHPPLPIHLAVRILAHRLQNFKTHSRHEPLHCKAVNSTTYQLHSTAHKGACTLSDSINT